MGLIRAHQQEIKYSGEASNGYHGVSLVKEDFNSLTWSSNQHRAYPHLRLHVSPFYSCSGIPLVQDLPAVCFVVPVKIMRTWIFGKSEDGSGVKQVAQVWDSYGSPRGLRRTQGALVASILLWVVADHYSKKRNQYIQWRHT